jgi:hypothetical protein
VRPLERTARQLITLPSVACHQFEITGPGSEMPDTGFLVGFPGAYKADDPGLHLNIHDAMTKYTVRECASFAPWLR